MIDTNNVIQLRRVHYACPVERPERPAPLTAVEKLALVLAYAASVFIVFALIGWGWEEAKRIDWSAAAQLLGVMR